MENKNLIGLQFNDEHTKFMFHFTNLETKESYHINMNKEDIDTLYNTLKKLYEKS